jgi:prepilin-type N-terminal cleavage/methylation domain-containing protein
VRPSIRRSARSGFSMIEIMAVMIILGIVLMAIVPSIDGLVPKYRLRGGAREVAALIEEAQSQAISSRKEWNVAFDLDHDTFWLIMPPKERPADPAADPADPAAAPGSAESQVGKEGRPKDDLEHGLPPVDPAAPQDADQAEEEAVADRDSIEPMRLPTAVVFEAVVVGDEEKISGVVYVPFSHLGGAGSTLVGMKLSDERDAAPVWVRFNALTRTIEYADERPEVRTLSGGGDAGSPR